MILRDAVTGLLLAMSRFMTKKGTDMASRQELADAINNVLGEDQLDAIYINSAENALLPDIAVVHIYNSGFSRFLLDPDVSDTCPFGFTLEIHERCFNRYTEEELTALILHDILQNVQSDTAKIRFIKAYTAVLSKHKTSKILDMFDDISLSEVLFIGFTEICLRPFRVPANGLDYVATDDVLKTLGLADAYDSYLNKVLPMSNITPEASMEQELRDDYRDINTIINACMDSSIRHYYHVIREGVPLVTLDRVFANKQSLISTGFISRQREFRKKKPVTLSASQAAISESYNNPKDELEIRFAIDKIINAMRYAESEAEREVVLFKIKQLQLKLARQQIALGKKGKQSPTTEEKIRKLQEFQSELDDVRAKMMAAEIKTKRWSVYVKDSMPTGYDF